MRLGYVNGRKITSQTPLSPEITIQLGVAYDIDLGVGRLTPSVQSYFSSSFINTGFTPEFAKQEAFTRTDLRLTFLTADERFTVQGTEFVPWNELDRVDWS